MLGASESYIVNIDVKETEEYLEADLTVSKYDGSSLTLLNTFTNMEAIDMWNKLVGKKDVPMAVFANNHGINIERGNTYEQQNASIETRSR